MPYKDKNKQRACQKASDERHREARLSYRAGWMREWRKKCRATYLIAKRTWGRINHLKCRQAWCDWLINHGYGLPSRKMHYHHKDPKSKLFAIGHWMGHRAITTKNIQIFKDELGKCIYMPTREHTQLHKNIRKVVV